MKTKRFSLRRLSLLLLLIAAITAFVFLGIIPSQEAWVYSREISDALENCRSVTLVEFESDFNSRQELVFSRVQASAKQIASLRTATGAWIAPIRWHAMCYDPHHRVEIVRTNGDTFRFEMCFHCKNFKLNDGPDVTLPFFWRRSLVKLFTDAGMPPRKDYSELESKHPDFPAFKRAQREFLQEIDKAPQDR